MADTLPDPVPAITAHENTVLAHGPAAEDEFYKVPADSAIIPPGKLIKLEADSDTSLYTLPPYTALSRIIYQTETLKGKTVPASAAILWPYLPRTTHSTQQSEGKGRYPVVVWAHGTTGMLPDSAPSNHKSLSTHWQAPFPLVLNGYVVIVVDYAGLGVGRTADGEEIIHEFMANPAQANDIVYAVQATQEAFDCLSDQFVVFGQSQGGGAAWAVAQRQAKHPVKGYLGAIASAPVTDFLKLPETGNPLIPLLAAFASPVMKQLYPDFEPRTLFTDQGWERFQLFYATTGNVFALIALMTGSPAVKDDWRENPYVRKFVELVGNGGREISGPLLVVNGEIDPAMNVATTVSAAEKTAQAFPDSRIQLATFPGVTHDPVLFASQRIWLDWIAERFNGVEVKRGCERIHIPEPKHKPLATYQTEMNWTVRAASEPYEIL